MTGSPTDYVAEWKSGSALVQSLVFQHYRDFAQSLIKQVLLYFLIPRIIVTFFFNGQIPQGGET